MPTKHSLNNQLFEILSKYGDDETRRAAAVKEIVELYNNPELQRARQFYSHTITNPTALRWLRLLIDIVCLQGITQKSLYCPGVGLFVPEYPKDCTYSFPEDYTSLPRTPRSRRNKKKFAKNTLTQSWRINIRIFRELIYRHLVYVDNPINEEHNTVVTSIMLASSKVRLFQESINNQCETWEIKVILQDKYTGGINTRNIELECQKYENFSLSEYLQNSVDISEMIFNIAILEDLLWLVGYKELLDSQKPNKKSP